MSSTNTDDMCERNAILEWLRRGHRPVQNRQRPRSSSSGSETTQPDETLEIDQAITKQVDTDDGGFNGAIVPLSPNVEVGMGPPQPSLQRRDSDNTQMPPEQIGVIVGCCLGALVLVIVLVWCTWARSQQRALLEPDLEAEQDMRQYYEQSEVSGSRLERRRREHAQWYQIQRMRWLQAQQQQQQQQQAEQAAAYPPFPRSIPPPTLRPGDTPNYRVKKPRSTYNSYEYSRRDSRFYRG